MSHNLSALRVLHETEDKAFVFDSTRTDCWSGLVVVETPNGNKVPMRCTPEAHPCESGKILGTVICVQEKLK